MTRSKENIPFIMLEQEKTDVPLYRQIYEAIGGAILNGEFSSNVHSSLFDQAILAEFISEGHFARHIRRMRTLYETRQKILVAECEKHLKNLLEIEAADAGMHLVGWLPEGIDDALISQKAAEKNLKLAAVSSYSARKLKRGGLILGYTAFDESRIKRGVKIIKELITESE